MMEPAGPVVLVSCGNRKLDAVAAAKDLYISDRFRAARKFAELYGAAWFVISAKHGMVSPDEILSPYDVDLKSLSLRDKRSWAKRVLSKLSSNGLLTSQLIVLADDVYSNALRIEFEKVGALVSYPFHHLPIGADLDILTRINNNPERVAHYKKFYDLMVRLQRMPGQMIPFGELDSKQLSKAGVYFFFDPLEWTRFYDQQTLRVVRVGTHGVSQGSKSQLWQRLRTHRGNDDGTGSHRSSIFRLHVGNAILLSKNRRMPSWGIGASASGEIRDGERKLEIEVSQYLRGLRVAFLPIVDEANADSDRSYIERNVISLLTEGGSIDEQGSDWLGNFSSRPQIKDSGLWNVNYVGESYDPDFLSVFEALIMRYEQGNLSQESLAPPNWRNRMRGAIRQQELF
jgi:hypothetical protein